MGQTAWLESSGEGEALLDSGAFHHPIAMLAFIGTVTSPRVRIMGTSDPRRVQFGGSAGLAGLDTDHSGATVTDYFPGNVLNFERNVFYVGLFGPGQTFSDRFWWRLPLGITWWFQVIWDD